ncbi:MAG: hypothetical protein VKI83_08260 [Synechococcaceae cyanobacterium]|nr:hypothetical protein [Synechococcaceae cyanobacterium]
MSRPSSLPLRSWYAALALIASAAALQAIVWPRWPRVAPLRPAAIETALRQAGWPVKLSTAQPGRGGYEISTSPLLSATLPGTGERLSLVAAAVRQRDSFQLAFISRDLPGLALRRRQLNASPPATASGRLKAGLARQSCLVPGVPGPAAFAVSLEDLNAAADRRNAGGRRRQLLRLAGLLPHRPSDCVLISLQAAAGRPLPDAGRWQLLLRRLQPALQAAQAQPGSGRR